MCNGFVQYPRSLLFHPDVIDAPAEQFKVLILLISKLRFIPELHNDHGLIFEVKVGEFCTTYDELAELAKVDRNHAVRAIKRFSKVQKVACDKEIFESQIVTCEVKRKKTLIKLVHKETYDLLLKHSEMKSEIKVKRSRHESETQKNKDNKENKENKEKNKKEKISEIPKIKFREWVELTQSEYDSLLLTHSDMLNSMLDILDAWNASRQEHYKSDAGALKTGGWVYKKAKKEKESDKIIIPSRAIMGGVRQEEYDKLW